MACCTIGMVIMRRWYFRDLLWNNYGILAFTGKTLCYGVATQGLLTTYSA